jgi:hypothetical protein
MSGSVVATVIGMVVSTAVVIMVGAATDSGHHDGRRGNPSNRHRSILTL